MKKSREKKCRFCNAELSDVFIDLGKSPLSNSYLTVEQFSRKEPFYPLCAYVCGECLLVQLEEFEKPENIFSDYAYFSSYSDTWLTHVRDYVDLVIKKFQLNSETRVVEVASNDGYLLQYFVEKNIPVLGIEPALNVAKAAIEKNIPTEVGFFNVNTANKLNKRGFSADLLLGNNVLAHVSDINDFISAMKILLKPNGVITMEFPHLVKLIEGVQFDTIYHEHFSYFSFLTVEKIFAKHGIAIFDVEEIPTHGGSLRIYGRHSEDNSKEITCRVKELKSKEINAGYGQLQSYLSFKGRVLDIKEKIIDFFIKVKKEEKTVVGYGAPAKGNTLLNYCKIGIEFIDYTVDRNLYKQGRFLPGVHIPIYSPDKIKETKPDYLFILPWNLKEEIINQMSFIRNWGGEFVVPIPRIEIM